MKSHLTTLLILLFLPIVSFSQSASMENVLRYTLRGSGTILHGDELQGYWTFFVKEKEDRKNYSYEVLFHDNNLKEVASFHVVKPKETRLLEIVSNDNAFMMTFYEKKTLEFEIYDRAGKLTGSKKITDIPKLELVRINQAMQSEELDNITAYNLGTNGFVRNGYTKNEKTGYELTAYDNTMKELWSFGSDPNSKLLETSSVMSTSEKYVALTVARKKNLFTKSADSFFILLDAATGTKLLEMPMKDKTDGELSLINLQVDEVKNEVLLLGEYYNPGDEVLKDQSQGIYAQRIDMKGNELALAKYTWTKDIAKLRKESMTDEQAAKDKGQRLLYIHKIIVTPTGDIYAVGEEYRKTLSAAGTTFAVLNGGAGRSGASTFQLTIENLVVIQINSKLELVGYKLIEKKKNRVALPPGFGYANAQMLAAYVKATGGFDYQFTSIDKAKSNYTVVYSDLNKKADEGSDKADIMIGSITIKGGQTEAKRTPINSEAKYVTYQPAKPGYIMIVEYFRKEKKLELHLEKI